MMSLFSSFDLVYFNKIFIIFFTLFGYLLIKFWKMDSSRGMLCVYPNLSSFFLSLKSKSFPKFTLMVSLFGLTFLALMNFLSVFSYTFPLCSSFGLVAMFSLTLWMSLTLFSLACSFTNFFSHLIPEGSPLGLSFLLFLIELISSMIRPLTLTVRLTANILAGHLLMILLYKLVYIFPLIFPVYVLLNLVEIFVSLIQAYIFFTMVSLYFSEVH